MNDHIVSDWYETQALSDDIFLIREKYVAHWLRCNIWLVKGRDRNLVIDSGMGLSPLKPGLLALAGSSLTAVMTHCHFDHIGGLFEFEDRLGHRACSDNYLDPMSCFKKTGGEAFVRAETFSALPFDGFSFESYKVRPAPLTGYLDEGDVLDLGDRRFQVLSLPGHSPDSIALWESKTETLFGGDTIYDGALYDTVYHSDPDAYRESLERLRALPIQTVHGGHFGSFGRDRMNEVIEGYLAGEGRLVDPNSWVNQQLS